VTSASSSEWSIGAAPVSAAKGSLFGETTAGIYDGSVKNYAFYNDQLPNGSWSSVFGHVRQPVLLDFLGPCLSLAMPCLCLLAC
jgi:hypothetical protein